MTENSIIRAALCLENYLTFRAEREGLSSELTSDFFARALRVGIRNLFGIDVAENGDLLRDFQNPSAFALFRNPGTMRFR